MSSTSDPTIFLPTTQIWPENYEEFLVIWTQVYENMVNLLNRSDLGIYDVNEILNGQTYFPTNTPAGESPEFRNVFRKVVNFGALPNTGTSSVAHNISVTVDTIFTRIYGTATDPNTSFIPVPYIDTTTPTSSVQLDVDPTNVIITTGADFSGYTECYVVLEYLKAS